MELDRVKDYLDKKVAIYNAAAFIENDPISIPHQYLKRQDVEITAFWTAVLSWGQRKTIISKASELFSLMDGDPYLFIMEHKPKDLKRLLTFKHRTFQPDDTLFFINRLRNIYSDHDSLEEVFLSRDTIYESLTYFNQYFFSDPAHLPRTRKHLSDPSRGSACKRLNMFLRWMVRKDTKGVDFGIWNRMSMSDLMIPLDIHVYNVAQSLGILKRNNADWTAVEELTAILKTWNAEDPVIYDYALFSIGLEKRD